MMADSGGRPLVSGVARRRRERRLRSMLRHERMTVDDCWFICSRSAEDGLFHADSRAGGPLRPAALLFLVEVCYVFVAGVWEVELLVAVVLVGCIGSWGSG